MQHNISNSCIVVMVYVVKGPQYSVYTVYIDADASVTENQMESESGSRPR